jgi:hypothetical protein
MKDGEKNMEIIMIGVIAGAVAVGVRMFPCPLQIL